MPGDIYFKQADKHVEVLGRETILETGLKAGIPLKYRCSNGNCGECKAYLRAGKLIKTRHHDFVLPDFEQHDHAFLMCSNTPDGDVEIEADSITGPADIPLQTIEARVKSLEKVDEQVRLLHIRTPRANRLQFLAGQSVTLGGNHDIPAGSYPIASCPCDDMNLFFHIPLVPGEPFSDFIFSDEARKCKKLQLSGPEGSFFFNRASHRTPVFITWHTGFAPAKSLIETVIAIDDSLDLHLYRVSPTPGRHYLNNVCRAWSDALDNFHYHPLTTPLKLISTTQDVMQVMTILHNNHNHLAEHDFYIIGPPAFVEGTRRVIASANVNENQIKVCTICMGLMC